MAINLLYEQLLKPSDDLLSDIGGRWRHHHLRIGGKMGPALARLARVAADAAGVKKK